MDYTHLAGLINDFTGYDITMSGKRPSPFSISMPLGGDSDAATGKAFANTKLNIDRVYYQGVDLQNIKVPVTIQGGVARAKVNATLNGGTLSLAPSLKLTGNKMLSLPDNSTVFTNVALTSALVNESLVQIHPMLKDSAVTSGKIHMDINRFRKSLADDRAAPELAGVLRFESTVLTPGGVVGRSLELAQVNVRNIHIVSTNINFHIENDRLYTSPLIFSTGKSTLRFEGSTSLDGDLDYYVVIPITPKLVGGGSTYEKLKDDSIRIPIKGRSGKEILDHKGFTRELMRLTYKAEAKERVNKELDRLKDKLGSDEIKDKLGDEAGKILEGIFNR